MKNIPVPSLCGVLMLVSVCTGGAYACGPEFAFRSYLNTRFWQPLSKYEQSLDAVAARTGQPALREEKARKKHTFAGMSEVAAADAVQKVRSAYRSGAFTQAEVAMDGALHAVATESKKEELLLIDAKIGIRKWEKGAKNEALLKEAQAKLLSFLKTSRIPSWQSEARGWLARSHYLLEEYSSAAKIYLDELRREDSVYSRQSLITSLRTLFPYNGSSVRLAEHLEEYFDTPEHALFVVNIVTNPVYSDDEERANMARVAQKAIDALQKHRELFRTGPLSDQLALVLMRAAIYRGDTVSALSYSRMIASTSETLNTPEYNWMVASARFLHREYKEAEAPLLKVLHSGKATPRDRNAAAQGLIGVYQKTGRRVDQLHAAFIYETLKYPDVDEENQWSIGGDTYVGFTYWPMGGELFDLPYLLDVQLTDDELLQYLERYSKQARQMKMKLPHRERTAYEMVRYALAVRYAREEKYRKAAEIYKNLRARPRAG